MKGLIAGLALTLALGLTTGAQADAVKERYDQSCTYCHSSGAAGAPKTGPRRDLGPTSARPRSTLTDEA